MFLSITIFSKRSKILSPAVENTLYIIARSKKITLQDKSKTVDFFESLDSCSSQTNLRENWILAYVKIICVTN